MAKSLNKDYSREDVQVATKHMRKHSTFLVVKPTFIPGINHPVMVYNPLYMLLDLVC